MLRHTTIAAARRSSRMQWKSAVWSSPHNKMRSMEKEAPTFWRCSSSSSSSNKNGSVSHKENPNARLGRTLYRQLLRWCASMEAPDLLLDPLHGGHHLNHKDSVIGDDTRNNSNAILLSAANGALDESLVPKLSLLCDSAEELHEFRRLRQWLPPHSRVNVVQSQVWLRVETPAHIQSSIQLAFRLAARSSVVGEKERLTMAFETLKTLNQWAPAIQRKKQQRLQHSNREGVVHHVGQVVQHATDRWRGVICGWSRRSHETDEKKEEEEEEGERGETPRRTSLTTKRYFDFIDQDEIHYDVIVDAGDAHVLGGGGGVGTHSRKANETTGLPVVVQSQLQPISDLRLSRIRSNWIPSKFERFNPQTGTFTPKPTLAWEYPADDASSAAANQFKEEEGEGTMPLYTSLENPSFPRNEKEIAQQVVEGVQGVARRLHRCVLDVTSCAESRNMRLLSSLERRLEDLSQGRVQTSRHHDQDDDDNDPVNFMEPAARHLRLLLQIALELSELQWQRRLSQKHKSRIRFSLGDMVKHVKYGFRGVVIAWDPTPAVDVSRWDGLQDVSHPTEQPFYHVIPNQDDCRQAFGGERPFRYVCEANLVACPTADLDVDLDPDEWKLQNAPNWRFEAPEELKFKYAEDLGEDEEAIVNCIHQMRAEVARVHKAIRDGQLEKDDDGDGDEAAKLSLDNLFALLRVADTLDHAVVLEETVKEVWKVHDKDELRWRLDDGIAELLRGNKDGALTTFTELVQEDPLYFEAWNKKATCHFMRGEMQESAHAARQTLDLHPRHFQALNGLGLVQYETNRFRLAAESFRQALDMDPWSPVSSRFALCLDQLKRIEAVEAIRIQDSDDEEEEGAQEGTAPLEKPPHVK